MDFEVIMSVINCNSKYMTDQIGCCVKIASKFITHDAAHNYMFCHTNYLSILSFTKTSLSHSLKLLVQLQSMLSSLNLIDHFSSGYREMSLKPAEK